MMVTRFKTQSIIHYFDAHTPWLRYGLAVLATAIAATATHAIPVMGGQAAFLLFFFAIIPSSFWLGFKPGLLAMVLSLIAVNALFLFPAWISSPHDTFILNMGFCALSAAIITTSSYHRNLSAAIWESRQDLAYAQALAESRLCHAGIVEKVAATVPGVICSFRLHPDGSTSMPYASPVFESVYGFSADTVLEDFSPVFARIHPDDIARIHETIAESARTMQPWRDSFRYHHPSKGEIWIEGHSMPQREIDGGILWQGYIQDVTEHKHAEARLALILEEVHAGYWDWDLQSRTLFLSSEWKRQIGYDTSELPNRWEEWESRLHPDDRASVLAATDNYITGLLPVFELEFRLCHKDGSYRWIHSRGALLRDPHKHPIRMLGINLDISDYKQDKELNEQRDKMEQSFRLYVAAQTAAAIAHELNQPLTAISAYADVALQLLQTGHQNSPKLSYVIENCALQAQRAGHVMRQLLTLLQKGEDASEPLDINVSIREALDLIKADGYLGLFKIGLVLANDMPPVVANRLQIQKVLLNLLRNSLESMKESGLHTGKITVTTRHAPDDPSRVLVTVCDQGKGVADTTLLKTMFQAFYTTKPTGLGMGLAISRSLVEAHGGKMWAEQNIDSGISIHFTLPFVT